MKKPDASRYSQVVRAITARLIARLPEEDRERLRLDVAQDVRAGLRGTIGVGRVMLYVPGTDTDERQMRQDAIRKSLIAGEPAAVVARRAGVHFTTVYSMARRLREKKGTS